jgi:hypothetical protein
MEGEYAGEELRREVSISVIQFRVYFEHCYSYWRLWLNDLLLAE